MRLISIFGAFFRGGTGGPLVVSGAIGIGKRKESLEVCARLICPSGNDDEIGSTFESLNCSLLDVLVLENRVFRGGMTGFLSDRLLIGELAASDD